jgi:hypothetical protein
MTTAKAIAGPTTTGIGSLPHHNIDAALAFSFQMGLPFLPQIPIRNPWEFMIAQVLDGMPGIVTEKDGSVTLDSEVWLGRSHAFNERLLNAFASMARPDAFVSFEPTSATSSCWQPFLWELEERGVKTAKVQLAGPLTSQWVLRLKDGSNIDRHPEIASQIYRLVLARALAMTRRLQAGGIQPLIYFDEPALYGFTSTNPRHALGLQELKLLVQALRKEDVLVGLHCCSNTDWSAVLQLGLHYLSLDTGLSLKLLLSQSSNELEEFLSAGGRLSLGVVPTSINDYTEVSSGKLLDELIYTLSVAWAGKPSLIKHVLSTSLFTPACGLALQSTSNAETILATLLDFHKNVQKAL